MLSCVVNGDEKKLHDLFVPFYACNSGQGTLGTMNLLRMDNFPYLIFLLLPCWVILAHAATTDPAEVELLKTFHDKLVGDGPAVWNFSVDPCTSDLSSWRNVDAADNFDVASGVKCVCTYQNNTVCLVTKLVVVSMNVAGQIAPEIGNFTILEDLNLAQNMLTGPIPKEIGRLPMKYLSVGKNRLSGTLPPEIGNFSSLFTIGISLNKFTGTLPKEIGNLKSLREMYFDDNEFEGEIPAGFADLTKITIIHGTNNYLNGSIPDIFENMTLLQTLKLYGNKFRGQVPSSLWNLTNLKKVYLDGSGVISNLSLPSSLVHLKALNQLSIRNCGLTGKIPAQIGGLTNLTYLDLSFNNLTGGIPSTFGSLASLKKLFLGSNNLTGELPSELNNLTSLQYIDLSYNQLSGSVPTWLSRSGLNANLIWNLFDTSKSNSRAATSFNCLDMKSPCTRTTTGKNTRFSINCGGNLITSYDDDSITLGYANVRIHSNKRWAVSTTGDVEDDGYDYISKTTDSVNVSNVLEGSAAEASIYQTARSSPSSLRYFGLDMVNGNYSLELHFAEIKISANQSEWQSTGKRLFDIYIQGEKIYENFDIVDRANGSFKALVVKHTVQVTQGVLEVHLKWSEQGTCCIPKSKTFGPLISAIVVTPEFDDSTTSRGRIIGISVGVVGAVILICLITFFCWRRRRQLLAAKQAEYEDFKSIENKPNIFTYNELKVATKGFHQQNKLGEGGFGAVYKGVLPEGTLVAVKKLSSNSDKQEFLNEVSVISSVKHRNLVKLLGCCFEGDHRILVLEFLENNSLQQALLGPPDSRLVIDWPTRFNICVEIAKGIAYLHEESLPRIIHRDIKASNILLDKKLQPKIADFGLAKLFADEQSHISTKVAGTVGYLSPEYAMRGQLTEKVDVYAFGVLALEIISGRSNVDLSLQLEKAYLLEWVLHLNKEKALLQVIDLNLRDQYSEEEAMTIIEAAILCTQSSPNKRPTMSKVVAMLTGSSTTDFTSESSIKGMAGFSATIKKRFETLVSHKREDTTT